MRNKRARTPAREKTQETSVPKPRKRWMSKYVPRKSFKEFPLEKLLEFPDAEIREWADGLRQVRIQAAKNQQYQKEVEQALTAFEQWRAASRMLETAKELNEEDAASTFQIYKKSCKLANNPVTHQEDDFMRLVSQKRRSTEEQMKIEQMQRQIEEIERSVLLKSERRDNLIIEEQEVLGLVRVYLRIRPAADATVCQPVKDYEKKVNVLVSSRENCMDPKKQKIEDKRDFAFDGIFWPSSSQEEVFDEFEPAIKAATIRKRVAIFGYGSTNSGKSYTLGFQKDAKDEGLIQKIIRKLFTIVDTQMKNGWQYNIKISAEEMTASGRNDLLSKLELPGHNLTYEVIQTQEQALLKLKKILNNRSTSQTGKNTKSSRSHLLLSIDIQAKRENESREGLILCVDLAGNQKYGVSANTQQTVFINQSLSALTTLFRSFIDGSVYRPPANSLPAILLKYLHRDVLNFMIANVSPHINCIHQTGQTVKFASGLRDIRKK